MHVDPSIRDRSAFLPYITPIFGRVYGGAANKFASCVGSHLFYPDVPYLSAFTGRAVQNFAAALWDKASFCFVFTLHREHECVIRIREAIPFIFGQSF